MTIRRANGNDVENIATIHESVLPGFFMTSLGHGFLKTFYSVALNYHETICLVAVDEHIGFCGFVFGRPHAKGYLHKVLKKGIIRFAFRGVLLIFTKPMSLIRLAKNLDKKDKSGAVEDNQDYAEIGLIGVKSEMKGQGIGHRLYNAFETEVCERGAQSVSLTTDYYNNENTLISYKAWGFRVLYEFVTYPDRRMYRLIKDIVQ